MVKFEIDEITYAGLLNLYYHNKRHEPLKRILIKDMLNKLAIEIIREYLSIRGF